MVHHGVHGVLELENLALHIDCDLAGEIAFRHRGGDVGNVPDLARKIRRHCVDVVGQILPRAGHARHLRLATKFSLRTDLARDTSYF